MTFSKNHLSNPSAFIWLKCNFWHSTLFFLNYRYLDTKKLISKLWRTVIYLFIENIFYNEYSNEKKFGFYFNYGFITQIHKCFISNISDVLVELTQET